MMKRQRLWIMISVVLVVGAVSTAVWFERDREKRLWESCANCRSFIQWDLRFYAETNGGWYPKGAGSALASLALAINKDTRVDNFTSHKQGMALVEHWKQHGELKEEHMCHRYVEGLHKDDGNHILMYFHRPTYYECRNHKESKLGRPVMTAWLHWEFMPEDKFQEQFAKTMALIESRKTSNTAQ